MTGQQQGSFKRMCEERSLWSGGAAATNQDLWGCSSLAASNDTCDQRASSALSCHGQFYLGQAKMTVGHTLDFERQLIQ